MKISILTILSLLFLSVLPGQLNAQDKQKAKISTIRQTGKTVGLKVTSPDEFYFGGNKHYLHIGQKHFDLYEQQNDEGKGSLNFLIPASDFKSLKDGERVFLSYGDFGTESDKELEELSSQNYTPCWDLGKLNKKMLK